jgi:hypothetical protein
LKDLLRAQRSRFGTSSIKQDGSHHTMAGPPETDWCRPGRIGPPSGIFPCRDRAPNLHRIPGSPGRRAGARAGREVQHRIENRKPAVDFLVPADRATSRWLELPGYVDHALRVGESLLARWPQRHAGMRPHGLKRHAMVWAMGRRLRPRCSARSR